MILKFNTCLILMKNVKSVVKNATNVWKVAYHLHKLTKDPVDIKDDEEDNTPSITVSAEEMQDLMKDREEEKKEEAEEEEK